MAHDFAASIEAEQHMALDEVLFDPDEDRGIILLAVLGIPGHIEIAPVLAEHARLAIVQAEDGDADAAAVIGLDLDAHYQIALDLDIVPGAVKVGWLAIERIAGLSLHGGAAQQQKHENYEDFILPSTLNGSYRWEYRTRSVNF